MAIDSTTLQGLPQIGTDLGSFLTNLAPGIGNFIIVLAILGGIGGLIGAIIVLIRGRLSN